MGASLPRKDASAKVRGETLFAEDLADRFALGRSGPIVAGGAKSLVGKMLFSERSHARIASLDVSGRLRPPSGVALVLTAKDVPGLNAFGLFVPQQPVIAKDEVLYLGDVVAVVLAETARRPRREGLSYRSATRSCPVLSSPEANMEEGAPLVHPETENNVVHETHVRKGDSGSGLRVGPTS